MLDIEPSCHARALARTAFFPAKAEQKQRYYERNIRKYKRLRDCALDDENKAKYDTKVKEWSRALDKHLDANPSLRKNPWRESKRGNDSIGENKSGNNLRGDFEELFKVEKSYSRSVKLTEPTKQELRNAVDKYNTVIKPINDDVNYIYVEPYGNDKIYGSTPDYGNKIILYGYYGNNGLEQMGNVAGNLHKLGEWSTNSKYHPLWHEMSHVFINNIRFNYSDKWKIIQPQIEETFNNFIYEASRLSEKKGIKLKKAYGELLSFYSSNDIYEFVSEALAEFVNGNPRPYAKKIHDIIFEVMNSG